jgi:hypothetical protein
VNADLDKGRSRSAAIAAQRPRRQSGGSRCNVASRMLMTPAENRAASNVMADRRRSAVEMICAGPVWPIA